MVAETSIITIQGQSWLLKFLTRLFSSLEIDLLRPLLMKLLNIGIWNRLTPQRLALELAKAPEREKLWSKNQKKFESGNYGI